MPLEELISRYPAAVRFLLQKGIRCLECGEPAWGTLEENARQRGYEGEALEDLVRELIQWLERESTR